MTAGRAVALGDQPAGNDEGLTRWHPPAADGCEAAGGGGAASAQTRAIPFLSVSEREEMVPSALRPWHVSAGGGNAAASGAVLNLLAEAEAAAQAQREGGGVDLDLGAARELVRRANLEASLPRNGSEEALA